MKVAGLAVLSALFGAAAAFAPAARSNNGRVSTGLQETKADLEKLAGELNPVVKFYDPLRLSSAKFWGQDNEFTIGFLRQAEVKHGRVAMAAFVGYCVQSNWVFPWDMTLDGQSFPSTDLSPPEQWDALPVFAKMQIILFVGFLEFYSELTPKEGAPGGLPHYTKGGKVGQYPTFDAIPHPVPLNLYDPIGRSVARTDAEKANGLIVELNNGRLAMLGIFGFLCAQTIPGSVPVLSGIVKPYAGEVMAPLA